MSSALNKRQQQRNERALQELIKTVPGNDRCADCGTRNPGWASWSLGIFLCIRCASLHRKLGTHVSKVKSISMDSWSNEQVENMRKTGNAKSNAHYNPDPMRNPPPLATEDTDSNMERHIRAKYEYQTLRRNASTSSAPSTSSSASTASTSTSFGATTVASSSSSSTRRPAGSPPTSKASQILGATPYTDSSHSPPKPQPQRPFQFPHGMVQLPPEERYEDQLKQLQEMGFTNPKKNVAALQKTDGNILQAVESLIGARRKEEAERRPEPPPKKEESNPFEALDKEGPPLPPLPITRDATGTSLGGGGGGSVGYQQQQPQQLVQQQPIQTGFPQQQQQHQPYANPPLPLPQPPQLFTQTSLSSQQQPQQNGFYSSIQVHHTGYSLPSPQQPQQSNPFLPQHAQTVPSTPTTNTPYNPFLQQQPQQPQPQSQLQPQLFQHATFPQQQQQPLYQQPAFLQQQPSYQPVQPQPQQISKSAILSLYNTPGLAPQPPMQQVPVTASPLPQQPPPPPPQPQVGSNNPFAPKPAGVAVAAGHHSRDDSWAGGRHSPDAFASLAFGGR